MLWKGLGIWIWQTGQIARGRSASIACVLTKELDKCYENQLRYIQWIEIYPMNNIIHPFEQLGPDVAERGFKALKYIVRKKLSWFGTCSTSRRSRIKLRGQSGSFCGGNGVLKAVSPLKSSEASCFGCGLSGLCLLTTHFILQQPPNPIFLIFFSKFWNTPIFVHEKCEK